MGGGLPASATSGRDGCGRGRKREGERAGEVAAPRGSGDLGVGGGLPIASTSGQDGGAEADMEG
jgi:hypothetical protein